MPPADVTRLERIRGELRQRGEAVGVRSVGVMTTGRRRSGERAGCVAAEEVRS